MHWHFTMVGQIHEAQNVRQSSEFIAREKLFNRLQKRYNYDKFYRQVIQITLPHSKAKAKIVWNDAQAVMTSLLTDPQITDNDYLFFKIAHYLPHQHVLTSSKTLTQGVHT